MLDHQPYARVVVMGVILGLGLGIPGFFYLRSPAWMLLWGGLFVALWRMAAYAEPVFEEANPVVAEARPTRVQDGPLTMIELPGGQFLMGSPDTDELAGDDEKPQHMVTVSGFRMAVTPVTAGLYNEVMQREPVPQAQERLPAVNVSWEDAIAFCNRLSVREGYRRCYRRRFKRWVCDWRADGYRLPTEAEWEYACRAGTATRYAFGDDPERLGNYAWFAENACWAGAGSRTEVAQSLGTVRHARQCLGMVLGLVQRTISSWRSGQSCGTCFWILSGGARRVVRRLARGPALRGPGRRPPRGQGRVPSGSGVCASPQP